MVSAKSITSFCLGLATATLVIAMSASHFEKEEEPTYIIVNPATAVTNCKQRLVEIVGHEAISANPVMSRTNTVSVNMRYKIDENKSDNHIGNVTSATCQTTDNGSVANIRIY